MLCGLGSRSGGETLVPIGDSSMAAASVKGMDAILHMHVNRLKHYYTFFER